MPRPATGTVLRYAGGASASITVESGPKGRVSFPLGVKSEKDIETRSELLADTAQLHKSVTKLERCSPPAPKVEARPRLSS